MDWIENWWKNPPSEQHMHLMTIGISAISALISLLGVIIVVIFAWRNFGREKINQRLTFFSTQQKYFEDVKKWAEEVCDLCSEAIHLCDIDPSKAGTTETVFEHRHRLRLKLSSAIDKGRWFFPNIQVEQFGKHKPSAFRGFRHAVLDSLVGFYRVLNSIDYVDKNLNTGKLREMTNCFNDHKHTEMVSTKDLMIEFKRKFVSEIQKILDPKCRQQEYNRLMNLFP